MNKYGEDGWEYVGNFKKKTPQSNRFKGFF